LIFGTHFGTYFSAASDYDPASTGPKPGLAVSSESIRPRFGHLLYGSLSGASGEMLFFGRLIGTPSKFLNFMTCCRNMIFHEQRKISEIENPKSAPFSTKIGVWIDHTHKNIKKIYGKCRKFCNFKISHAEN